MCNNSKIPADVCIFSIRLIHTIVYTVYIYISFNVTELNCLCSHAACYCNWLVVFMQNNGKKLVMAGPLLAIKILFCLRKIKLNI